MKGESVGLSDARLRELVVNTGGFALFLTWVYSSFYSGNLLGYYRSTLSLPEYFWSSAALGLALMAVVMAYQREKAQSRLGTTAVLAGAVLMCVGDVAIWLAFAQFNESPVLYRGGGFIAGCGEALVMAAWLRAFVRMPAVSVGTSLVSAFVLAFIIYLALLPLPDLISLTAVFSLPFVSAAAALYGGRNGAGESANGEPESADSAKEVRTGCWREVVACARSIAKPLLLLFFLSLNCAFLRYIASPWYLATEPWFYATVFASAIATATLVIGWTVVRRPHKKFGDLRVAALVLCASYLILYIDFANVLNGTISYAVNLVCTAGIQLFLWSQAIATAKARLGRPGPFVFLCAAAFGLGIFAGVVIGDVACNISGKSIPVFVPLLFLCVLFALVLFVPFSFTPLDEESKTADEDDESPSEVDAAQGGEVAEHEVAVDANAVRAELLASHCGLSEREAQVLELLLSGRSRPFIHQTLFISLGTVNTHVSSIYRKTGVHSLQELISLAESCTHEDDELAAGGTS